MSESDSLEILIKIKINKKKKNKIKQTSRNTDIIYTSQNRFIMFTQLP